MDEGVTQEVRSLPRVNSSEVLRLMAIRGIGNWPELSRQAGISDVQAYRVRDGENITVAMLGKVARALGVRARDILVDGGV